MKNIHLYRYLTVLSILVLAVSSACRRSQPATYENADLNGNWVRIESTKPKYDSMVVVFDAATAVGVITSVPSGGSFATTSVKWRDVTPEAGPTFTFEDLGSDGNYYEGIMTYKPSDANGHSVLTLEVEFGGHQNGETQTWKRY